MVELAHRFSDSGRDVRSNEARDGSNAVTDAHQRAGVLRRNVHVVDEVAGVHEATHTDRQYQQDDGQRCLCTVQVTQANKEHAGAKHTCNQPTHMPGMNQR